MCSLTLGAPLIQRISLHSHHQDDAVDFLRTLVCALTLAAWERRSSLESVCICRLRKHGLALFTDSTAAAVDFVDSMSPGPGQSCDGCRNVARCASDATAVDLLGRSVA